MRLSLFERRDDFDDTYLRPLSVRLSTTQTIEEDEALLCYTDSMGRNILHYLGHYGYHAAYLKMLTMPSYRDLGLHTDRDQLAPAAYWVPNAFDAFRAGSDVQLLTDYFSELVHESWHVSPGKIHIPAACRELLESFIEQPENATMSDHAWTLIGCIEGETPLSRQ